MSGLHASNPQREIPRGVRRMNRHSRSMKAPNPEPKGKIRICDECDRDTKHIWDGGQERYVCMECER